MALLFKHNQILIVIVSLLLIILYTISIVIKESNKFKFKFDFIKCFKYDSVDLFQNLFFLFIYLFGFSNAFVYGKDM